MQYTIRLISASRLGDFEYAHVVEVVWSSREPNSSNASEIFEIMKAMEAWLFEHFGQAGIRWGKFYTYIGFNDQNDAFAFKMRWG